MPAPVRLRPGLNISFQAQHVTGLMDYLTEQTHSTVSAPQAWLDKTIHPQIKIFTIILKRNLEKWNSQSEAPALICMFYQTCRAHFNINDQRTSTSYPCFMYCSRPHNLNWLFKGIKSWTYLKKKKIWIRK